MHFKQMQIEFEKLEAMDRSTIVGGVTLDQVYDMATAICDEHCIDIETVDGHEQFMFQVVTVARQCEFLN
jgi:hypothetical protein